MGIEVLHRKATVNGVRLHYTIAGTGEPVVLLHGFPQTSYQWRKIMPALAEQYTVIAPDYRGAGDSERPHSGYDKVTMATDIRELVEHVCPGERLSVVGHDIGALVAFALAAKYPEDVRRLCLIDAPILGTPAYDVARASPRVWHQQFHGARDVAEMLVTGRERAYLTHFFDTRSYHNNFAPEDLDVYVRAYEKPGALRAAFEAYRALPADSDYNRELLRTFKLPMPLLVVAGELSNSGGSALESSLPDIAENSRYVTVPESGHWISEEQPEKLLTLLQEFLAD